MHLRVGEKIRLIANTRKGKKVTEGGGGILCLFYVSEYSATFRKKILTFQFFCGQGVSPFGRFLRLPLHIFVNNYTSVERGVKDFCQVRHNNNKMKIIFYSLSQSQKS